MEINFPLIDSNDTFKIILNEAMKFPSVKIDRTKFLKKVLRKKFQPQIVDLAIQRNPAYAGITVDHIDKIAKSCIDYETRKVSAISAAAGVPGGLAMLGTIPGDIVQFNGHILRIIQKLVYLYGWDELYDLNGDFDDETADKLTLFIGVMFGVKAANVTVSKLSRSAAVQVQKSLIKKPLTKGVIYPIVKRIAKILGIKMTKEIFAKGVGKVVPVIGGVISGLLTYGSFKPLSKNFMSYLRDLEIADVNFYKQTHYDEDINFDDITEIEEIIEYDENSEFNN